MALFRYIAVSKRIMKHLLLLSAAVAAFHFANAGVGFTENRGQFTDQTGKPADNVLFRSCGTGPGIFVTTTGLTYVFEQKQQELVRDRDEAVADKINWSAIHMTMVGATIRQENIITEDALPGVNNYYYAHCPQGILGVRSYHTITIKEIYPGIDWIISADDRNGVMHDLLVHANGRYSDIRMKYDGLTAPITINSERKLVLTSAYGTIYEGGLVVKRKDDGKTLTSYFNVKNGNEVSYLIVHGGRPGHSFIIDPPLQWDTTMASSGLDYGSGVVACRDQSYDVLGCGYTDGVDFPVWNAHQGTISGQEDAVVYRLDASGNRIWSTYFGGTDIDNAKGIATDANGNAYVIGHTASQDLPVVGSLQANYGGGVYDAFIAKYDWQGAVVWASWRGGTGTDFGTAITADDNGMCYAVGYTNTTVNFPVLNALQSVKAGGAGVYDGFIMSFTAAQAMQWSTYYGGSDEDKLRAVALDAAGANIVIAGNTLSSNFPVAGSPFQPANAQWSLSDAVIMKMSTGQSVVFASFCGGSEDDYAYGITTDDAGNIYATGVTNSSDFPTEYVPTAYNDTVLDAILTSDAFVIKCNPTGTTLLWSTYFGGMAPDYGYAIGYDQYVGVYICGNTASTDFPVMQPLDMNYYQATHGDGGNFNDAFIAWFNVNDQLSWSTFYGGMNSEEAYGLSVSLVGDVYLTGVDSNEIYMAKFNPALPTGVAPVYSSAFMDEAPYPNPVSDRLWVDFYGSEGMAVLELTDMTGRLVLRNEFASSPGENRVAIDVAELAKGAYTLKLSTPLATHVFPVIKE